MTQEIITQISETVGTEVFGIWFLIGAAFVFFMQAGFAMVETGFTRAKNAGNIIMKNLMDFCIGTVVFIFLGFGLLLGEDALGGFIGLPTLGIFTDYANFDWSNFVFNLVFCATAATIVSGAMAERTKFLSYCIYSGVISAVVYRGTLDLGRRLACTDGIPRFCRFSSNPYSWWPDSIYWCGNGRSENWKVFKR